MLDCLIEPPNPSPLRSIHPQGSGFGREKRRPDRRPPTIGPWHGMSRKLVRCMKQSPSNRPRGIKRQTLHPFLYKVFPPLFGQHSWINGPLQLKFYFIIPIKSAVQPYYMGNVDRIDDAKEGIIHCLPFFILLLHSTPRQRQTHSTDMSKKSKDRLRDPAS